MADGMSDSDPTAEFTRNVQRMWQRHQEFKLDESPFVVGWVRCWHNYPEGIQVQQESDEARSLLGWGRWVFIPHAAIHESSHVPHAGDFGELVVKHWFAYKRDWVASDG